jgi:hypothetical protein
VFEFSLRNYFVSEPQLAEVKWADDDDDDDDDDEPRL